MTRNLHICSVCPVCGGGIVGDGYAVVRHCENAESDRIWDSEPDAPTIYCKSDEEKNSD
jgi:hypothetical protein